MSSTNKTANLNLHSWVRTDPVVCEDFNDNFTKIDTAVGNLSATRGNCEIYSGSYTGTGAKTFTLTFPKRPIYLAIQTDKINSNAYTGFVVNGAYFFGHYSNDHHNTISISGTTVTIQESGTNNTTLNMTNTTYHYLALAAAN